GQPGDERGVVAGFGRRQQAGRSKDVADRVELDEQDALFVFRDVPAGRAFGPVRLVEDARPRRSVMATVEVDHPLPSWLGSRRPRAGRLTVGGAFSFSARNRWACSRRTGPSS